MFRAKAGNLEFSLLLDFPIPVLLERYTDIPVPSEFVDTDWRTNAAGEEYVRNRLFAESQFAGTQFDEMRMQFNAHVEWVSGR